eukprot:gene17098-5102_t
MSPHHVFADGIADEAREGERACLPFRKRGATAHPLPRRSPPRPPPAAPPRGCRRLPFGTLTRQRRHELAALRRKQGDRFRPGAHV